MNRSSSSTEAVNTFTSPARSLNSVSSKFRASLASISARSRLRFSRNTSGSVSDVSTRARSVSARARSSVASGLAPSPRLARVSRSRAAARRRLASAASARSRADVAARRVSDSARVSSRAAAASAATAFPSPSPPPTRVSILRSTASMRFDNVSFSFSRSATARVKEAASKLPEEAGFSSSELGAELRLRLRSYFLCAAT